ncbi:DUF4870 family protein [Arenicella xantha]|uniref:Putative membrane protein n=1 Tax=Arenicella xantha TaxID=644221 RepID=A0A395JNE0_9GAMM|nr:hypothetical protein [Arenicella xantha]RBP53184.1 putative membrane protein [Arenicella xantha]
MSTIIDHDAAYDSEPKTHALIAYILMTIGLFTAVPMIFGAIWAMVKRGDSAGTMYHSHYTNTIRTFWWSLLWTIIGGILTFIFIGFAILGIVWLWALYRMVNGLIKIMADKPYPI